MLKRKNIGGIFLSTLLGLPGLMGAEGFFKIENNLFGGIGAGFSHLPLFTQASQNVYRESSACSSDGGQSYFIGTCYGGSSQASYSGRNNGGMHVIFGDETTLDRFRIMGLRYYASVQMAQVDLGTRQSYSESKSTSKIQGENANTTFDMLNPATPQNRLAGNAIATTLSLQVDVFANLPMDYFLHKLSEKIPSFQIGVFAGLGAEISFLKSHHWVNESLDASQREGEFYASGSGLFINLGGSLYLSRHDRIDIGVKIPYVTLKQVMWHSVGSADVWGQQTLRQSFETSKTTELRITYVFYF